MQFNFETYHQLPEFLAGELTHSFFQGPAFFRLAEAVRLFQPILITVRDNTGALAATLLAVRIRESNGIKGRLSERAVVYGGPVFYQETDKQELLEALLQELTNHVGGKTVFTQFRNFYDTTDIKETFKASQYRYRERLNLLLDTRDEKKVWQGMSESRRRQIRKSMAIGAVIREAGGPEEVEELYQILKILYRYKVKKPLPEKDFFLAFYEQLHQTPHGKVFVVTYQGRITGGIFCPVSPGRTVYELYVCGNDEVYQKSGIYPSVMATWAAINYAIKNNIPQFDFMGVGIPEKPYGVREFKMRFGGEIVNYGRYTRINNPVLYQLAEVGYNVLGWLNRV